jgi:hypothetical protein
MAICNVKVLYLFGAMDLPEFRCEAMVLPNKIACPT